jgi:hypothetical protein
MFDNPAPAIPEKQDIETEQKKGQKSQCDSFIPFNCG